MSHVLSSGHCRDLNCRLLVLGYYLHGLLVLGYGHEVMQLWLYLHDHELMVHEFAAVWHTQAVK